MGLLEQEIKELRTMNKRIMNGTITDDELSQRIAVYSQTEKRAKMMLQAFAVQAKYKKNASNNIVKSGLIGDGTVVDLGTNIEIEMIHCPDVEKNIARHECLDYSGSTDHMEDCQSCENFGITRKVLMGTK